MIDKETYKKILYFNSKNYFTKEEVINEIELNNIMLLYNYVNADAKINEFLKKCEQLGIEFLSQELEEKIKKLLELETITEELINSTFSFNEKVYILQTNDYLFEQLKEKCEKVRFLTDDEAIEMLKNNYAPDLMEPYMINSIRDDKRLIPFIKESYKQEIIQLVTYRNVPFSLEVIEEILTKIPLDDEEYGTMLANNIIKFLDNEKKVYYIKNSKDKFLIYELVRSLPTDLKLQYLNKVSKYFRSDVICSIDEDEIKVKFLNLTTHEKGNIIASFKSDAMKEEQLNKYKILLNGRELGKIIASFKDAKYIEKNLYLLKSDAAKIDFIIYADKSQMDNKIKLLTSFKKEKNILECIYVIKNSDNANDIIKNIKNQAILYDLFDPVDTEINHLIFQKLSEKNKEKALKNYREYSLEVFCFYQYLEKDDFLHETIMHTISFPEYDPSFDIVIVRLAKFMHLNPDRLITLARRFNLAVLAKIENTNIKNLLNASDEDFSKIMTLFSDEVLNFDDNNQNDALNALIQRKFRIKHPNEILIFTETRHAVADKNIDKVMALVNKVREIVSLERFNITREDLIKGLMTEDKDITELYNKITNEYLKILRANYDIEEKKKADILYKSRPYEKNSLVKYVINTISLTKIISDIKRHVNDSYINFTAEEKEIINNEELLREVLEFKKNPKNIKEVSSEVKKNIKNVEEIIRKTYTFKHFSRVKRNSIIKDNDKNELLEVLCELDINQIIDTVFDDEEKFQELLELLKKRKIPSWLGRFEELPREADVTLEPGVVASLITNYSEVRKHIFKDEATKIRDILTNCLKEYNQIDVEELLLEGLNDKKVQKTEILLLIKEMSDNTKIPIDKIVRKLLASADLLRIENLESAINILNPEIKSIYSKDKIKQVLEKINEFCWRLTFEKTIKGSPINPTEKEINSIFSLIEKIHIIIPELNNTFILENLFDSAIIFNNIDLEEALLNIDEKIKAKLSKDDIEKVLTTICSFVKNLKKGNLTSSTSILDIADCYDSSSKVLRTLFGKENFDLLKRNPQPYRGDLTSHERIKIALDLIKVIHKRKYVTVPPSRDIYTLSSNKKIKISVGDLHDFDNLTYGERTKAYMRIGGAGYSLFDFCLKNENGFHVKFTDPENDKIVSRVSGFRNGNTVFLNQLRYSLSEKYSNENIVQACKLFAKRLIEDSKDSSYPIENVVISPYYAMSSYLKDCIKLGNVEIQKGFKKFYSDVSEEAIVLATSSPDSNFVPVKTGPTKAEKYESLRREIKRTNGSEAYRLKYQILLLDEYYSGKDFSNIEVNMDDDIIYTIQGEDWYIAVSSKGEIESYIMKNSNNREKANEEMSEELIALKKLIIEKGLDSINIQSNLGGL